MTERAENLHQEGQGRPDADKLPHAEAPCPQKDTSGSDGASETGDEVKSVQSAESVVPELTNEQIQELLARAAEAEKNRELLLRVAADFENYKKRAAKERQEAALAAKQELIAKLLPVLDNFELALAHVDKATSNGQDASAGFTSLKTGIGMIYQQLKVVLMAEGVEEIDATGQTFDPFYHEAVAHEPSNEVADGMILRQVRKGYKFRGKVLRPASVVVAKRVGPDIEKGDGKATEGSSCAS